MAWFQAPGSGSPASAAAHASAPQVHAASQVLAPLVREAAQALAALALARWGVAVVPALAAQASARPARQGAAGARV
jgi:hypothetical protein